MATDTMLADMKAADAVKAAEEKARALSDISQAAGGGSWRTLVRQFEQRLAAFAGSRAIGTLTVRDLAEAGGKILLDLAAETHAKILRGLRDEGAPLLVRNIGDKQLAAGVVFEGGKVFVPVGSERLCTESWMRRYLLEGALAGRIAFVWHPRPSGSKARKPAVPKARKGYLLGLCTARGPVSARLGPGEDYTTVQPGEVFEAKPERLKQLVSEELAERVPAKGKE